MLDDTALTLRGAIEVAWWGSDRTSASPIVLLHEGLGSVSQWRDVPGELSARTGRRVMAYSRYGHGRSALPPMPRTVEFMHDEARLLPRILDGHGIGRAVLFGHSDGASIAIIAAAWYPERVEALVLEVPHVFVEACTLESIRRTTDDFLHGELRERLARHHDNVDAAFHGWSDVWLSPAFRAWNIEALLSPITCPVLLIQGIDDRYGTLRQLDAVERRVRGPVERLVLLRCGHAPHRDQPEAVLRAAGRFLTRHSGVRAPAARSMTE